MSKTPIVAVVSGEFGPHLVVLALTDESLYKKVWDGYLTGRKDDEDYL